MRCAPYLVNSAPVTWNSKQGCFEMAAYISYASLPDTRWNMTEQTRKKWGKIRETAVGRS